MENELISDAAKQLPIKDIYDDLCHPVLTTVGKGLQDAVKLALTPLSALSWGCGKIGSYLDVAIPNYFARKGITEEKIITPDTAIAVPVVEAMQYTSQKKEIRQMFVNLLGASMNKDIIDAHPAFVDIIKQLSPDESKMMAYLYRLNKKMPMIKTQIVVDDAGGVADITPYFSDICFSAGCEYPNKFPEYLDNLHRLGLVEVYYDRYLASENKYLTLKRHPRFPSPRIIVQGNDTQIIVKEKDREYVDSIFDITEFGKKFCSVCLDDIGDGNQ